ARVKEAKDELRRLKAEQLAAQCDTARRLLEGQSFPRFVVLNLAAGGSTAGGGGRGGGRGSRGGGADGRPVLMPALLVGETEPPREAAAGGSGKEPPPPLPYYACLAADNRLMRASVSCIAGVLCGPEGLASEEDSSKVWAAVKAVLAARQAVKAAISELEVQRRIATSGGRGQDGWLEKMARAKRLLKKAEKLRAECLSSGKLESTWKTFQ
ncbi:hypothetical protein VOLCADRAFT_101448, partial [Volvox carteri f. nagariensis]